jgi:hypothetical protein
VATRLFIIQTMIVWFFEQHKVPGPEPGERSRAPPFARAGLAIYVTIRCTGARQSLSGGVRAEEEVAEGAPQQIGDPSPCQMVRPIVDQVAALAQAFQIARPIVGRIVIEMRGGEYDASLSYPRCLDDVEPRRWPPASIAPNVLVSVGPAPIGETADGFAVRPSAFLA